MKPLRLVPALAIAALAFPSSALAFGFGPYFEYGGGSSGKEIEYDTGDGGKLSVDEDYDQFGFGVAFDSTLAADRLINYRASLGLEFKDVEADVTLEGPNRNVAIDLGTADLEALGVIFDNTLGFGVYRDPNVRVWLGPALRLGADFYDDKDEGGDRVDFLLGIGPDVGVNVHAGDFVTVALTGGYRYQFLFSALDVNGDDDFNDDDEDGFDDTGDGTEHLFFGRVTLFFRFGDRF